MNSTVVGWLRPVLPLLIALAVVGIVGMHALSSDHAAHGTTPAMSMHAGMEAASAEAAEVAGGSVDRAEHLGGSPARGTVTPPSHPAGASDCVPALLSTGPSISAPAVAVAIVPPPMYRTGVALTAREITPPRPSLIVLSISRT
ncbi:DUF6153 family protein [Microbacterium gorillae]|uniref:DUF6153 family protein n=1 Tax=Microbacterium gorillae TaxID=1231063 RepID=UPI003D986492